MIDTHCHLEMSQYSKDRSEVIQRALDAGLEAMITIGSDFKGCKGAVKLASEYDFIYASVGIHPHDSKDFTDQMFSTLKDWSRLDKVVAIGEIGLDYHYDHSPRDVQKDVFVKQLSFAVESAMPAIIHTREATEDTMAILKQSGISKGVMHCFSGDIEMAKRTMDMGLFVSIAGPVTFSKSATLKEVARFVPDEFLLLETDAPFLAPEPLRGKRNEPAYIVNTAKMVAELRGVTYEDIKRITTLNAKRLFGIGELPEYEIAYRIRDSLYLNITNRCTSRCAFCAKFHSDYVKGHNLKLSNEPSEQELKSAISDPTRFKEIVFCGYGEPLVRLDSVKSLAGWIKSHGGRVRINTNGHGNVIHKRNILPELAGLVDSVSISLNAHDAETYNRICRPAFNDAYSAVLEFAKEAKKHIPDVQVTVVTAEGVDLKKCEEIAAELGVRLKIRKLDEVG
ncbi:MAG: YchF/TatD family DNA exonuclease [Nitrospiraceae bacterium]|nr:YchF/TatD family DNA exonuclease [Nitrospiraceae bacterium]